MLAAGETRIPNASGWLRLKSFASEDQLCLLLSAKRLPLAEQKCPPEAVDNDKGESEPPPPRESKKEEKKQEKNPPPGSTRGPDAERKIKVIRLSVEGAV